MKKPDHPNPVVRKTVALPASVWAMISEYRHDKRLPSEREAVRLLVLAALKRKG